MSASAKRTCRDDGVREADKCLQTVLNGSSTTARLHLAHFVFDAGREDTALAHLGDYLSCCVERERNWCAGYDQKAGRRRANAHVWKLPHCEVLQRRSSEDGREQRRIGGGWLLG